MQKQKYQECQRCWKLIEKRWNRKYCLQCRKEKDLELAQNYVAKYHENKEKH